MGNRCSHIVASPIYYIQEHNFCCSLDFVRTIHHYDINFELVQKSMGSSLSEYLDLVTCNLFSLTKLWHRGQAKRFHAFYPHVAKPHSYCQCPISLVRCFFIIFLLKSMKFIPPNKSSKELILRAIDMFSWYSLKQQRKTVLLKRRIELKFYDNSEYYRFT